MFNYASIAVPDGPCPLLDFWFDFFSSFFSWQIIRNYGYNSSDDYSYNSWKLVDGRRIDIQEKEREREKKSNQKVKSEEIELNWLTVAPTSSFFSCIICNCSHLPSTLVHDITRKYIRKTYIDDRYRLFILHLFSCSFV